MAYNNWPNSAPLPPTPPQFCVPSQTMSSYGQPPFGGNHNTSISPYSAFVSGPAYNPFLTEAPDTSHNNLYTNANMSNMNSMALVEALLAPAPTQQSTRPSRRVAPSTPSQPRRARIVSSPLSRYGSRSHSGDAESDDGANNDVRRDRNNKRRLSSFPTPATAPSKHLSRGALTQRATSPNPRRSKRTKSSSLPAAVQAALDAKENSIKAASAKKSTPAPRPSKVSSKRLVRKKPQGVKVPDTLAEAGEADKMMWAWKNSGKDWEDIRNEWARITGIKPGKSSLSVRYIKLNENFARHGAAGDLELIRFRKEAEEELLSNLWDAVAVKMLAFNPLSEHNPKDLAKRYDLLVRSGFDIQKLRDDDLAKEAAEGVEAKANPAAVDAVTDQMERSPEMQVSEPDSTTYPSPYEDTPDDAHAGLLPFSRAFPSNHHDSFGELAADCFADAAFPRLSFPESCVFRGNVNGGHHEDSLMDPRSGHVYTPSINGETEGPVVVSSGNSRLVTYTSDSDEE